MLQKTFALLHRSLRTDVRLLRTHMFRAALLLFILYWMYEWGGVTTSGAPGLQMFEWLSYANFWFIVVAGGLYFSSAITEEKEEQTLGLLRLAGINPPALLLGKWLPRMIGALLLVSVQFPFTLLSITLGGVLIHQVVAAYCTLAAHLVLCGSIGLFASVVASRAGGAAVLAFLLMFCLSMTSSPIDRIAGLLNTAGYLPAGWIEDKGLEMNHAYGNARLDQIMTTGFAGAAVGFQVVYNLLLALVFAGASWLLFNRMTRKDTAAVEVSTRWITQLTRMGRRGSRRAWAMPIVWKDFYQIAGGGWTLVKFVGYPLLIMFVLCFWSGWNWWASAPTSSLIGRAILGVMLWVALLEVAVLAARVFREEVQAQTWPVLVMLPRRLADISYAKICGALLGLVPALVYFLFGALFASDEVYDFVDFLSGDASALLLFTYVVSQFVLFWHAATLLSVVWRWAAWPVSILFAGLFVLGGNLMMAACLAALPGSGPDEALLVALCFIGAMLVFGVHVWIGAALERLAGE